uniref:Uncharacterized protein n=1 Tax=Anguilla anguilla TaxID=7936 RepID=A0A0E9RGV2_ANGAN
MHSINGYVYDSGQVLGFCNWRDSDLAHVQRRRPGPHSRPPPGMVTVSS